MRAFGEDILDKKIVEKILITMPQKFDPIVTTIEETKDLSTLSEGSRNFLKNETDKNPPCNICKRQGHTEKNCWFRNMPQCNHCKKFGHIEKNCRNKNRHQANIAEDHDQEQCTFYAT